jgi:hypothetical protein
MSFPTVPATEPSPNLGKTQPSSHGNKTFGRVAALAIVLIGFWLLFNRAKETFPCPSGTLATGEINGTIAAGISMRLLLLGIMLLIVGARVASTYVPSEPSPEQKPRISFKVFIRIWMAAGFFALLSGGAMWFDETSSYYCATSDGIQLRPLIGGAEDIKWANVVSVVPECGYSRSRNFQPSQLILSVDVKLPNDRSIRVFGVDMAATYERISDLTANTPVIFDLSQTKRCPPAWQKIFAVGAK